MKIFFQKLVIKVKRELSKNNVSRIHNIHTPAISAIDNKICYVYDTILQNYTIWSRKLNTD